MRVEGGRYMSDTRAETREGSNGGPRGERFSSTSRES